MGVREEIPEEGTPWPNTKDKSSRPKRILQAKTIATTQKQKQSPVEISQQPTHTYANTKVRFHIGNAYFPSISMSQIGYMYTIEKSICC